MDRIIQNLMDNYISSHQIQDAEQDKKFEKFAAYCTVAQHYEDQYDIDDIMLGGGNDCGIDAMAIIVNGHMITSSDDIDDLISINKGLSDIEFILVQSKTTPGFSSGDKKPVRKDWIEDIVVSETMKMLMNDAAIEAIVSMVMALQDQENVNLPLYEKELRETKINIQNMLNAIQQGILTRSTKERLEELEAARDDLENKIACEKLAKPRISEEFITFWLHRFRKLDVTQKAHRKMLIDTFVNAIFLYDDKMEITYNYHEGTTTVTFEELKKALENQAIGSDMNSVGAPRNPL